MNTWMSARVGHSLCFLSNGNLATIRISWNPWRGWTLTGLGDLHKPSLDSYFSSFDGCLRECYWRKEDWNWYWYFCQNVSCFYTHVLHHGYLCHFPWKIPSKKGPSMEGGHERWGCVSGSGIKVLDKIGNPLFLLENVKSVTICIRG